MNSETQELIEELTHRISSYERVLGYYDDKPPEINMWPSLLKKSSTKD